MQFQKTLYYVMLILIAISVNLSFAVNEPVISTFTISPASPNMTSNLTTEVTSTSPLGYSVYYAYNWFVNGKSTTVLNLPFTDFKLSPRGVAS